MTTIKEEVWGGIFKGLLNCFYLLLTASRRRFQKKRKMIATWKSAKHVKKKHVLLVLLHVLIGARNVQNVQRKECERIGAVKMERLTDKRFTKDGFVSVSSKEYKSFVKNEKPDANQIYKRLATIEDILGETYDIDRLRELVEADREGRCAILPCKVGSVVNCVNGNPGKQEIVDCITIYDGGRMTYGFHEFGVSEVFVDEWSEDEVENYVVAGVGTDGGKSNE